MIHCIACDSPIGCRSILEAQRTTSWTNMGIIEKFIRKGETGFEVETLSEKLEKNIFQSGSWHGETCHISGGHNRTFPFSYVIQC